MFETNLPSSRIQFQSNLLIYSKAQLYKLVKQESKYSNYSSYLREFLPEHATLESTSRIYRSKQNMNAVKYTVTILRNRNFNVPLSQANQRYQSKHEKKFNKLNGVQCTFKDWIKLKVFEMNNFFNILYVLNIIEQDKRLGYQQNIRSYIISSNCVNEISLHCEHSIYNERYITECSRT